MLKINPGHPKVWLSQDHIQIGLDADAVTVGGLSPAHQRLLRSLEKGISENQLPAITRALKLDEDSAAQLIDRLRPVLLASDPQLGAAAPAGRRFPFAQPNPDFAEIIRFGLRHNQPGEQGIHLRSERIVHIDNLARTGITTVRGLASAGVTQFWCSDQKVVEAEDTSPLGFPKELLGWSRFMAADSVAGSFQNPVALVDATQLRTRVLDRVDIAILISGQVTDPRLARLWWRRGVPHLAVSFDASGVRVSPVVVPGKTPCLVCRDNELAATDTTHLVKFNQLITNRTTYDDASSVLFAAAAATTGALAQLDSQSGFVMAEHERAGVWFERKSGLVHRITWPSSAVCRCYSAEVEADGSDAQSAQGVSPAA